MLVGVVRLSLAASVGLGRDVRSGYRGRYRLQLIEPSKIGIRPLDFIEFMSGQKGCFPEMATLTLNRAIPAQPRGLKTKLDYSDFFCRNLKECTSPSVLIAAHA